jgi:hypothetical protein
MEHSSGIQHCKISEATEKRKHVGYPSHDIHIDTFESKLVAILSDFEGESPSEIEGPVDIPLVDFQVVISEGS